MTVNLQIRRTFNYHLSFGEEKFVFQVRRRSCCKRAHGMTICCLALPLPFTYGRGKYQLFLHVCSLVSIEQRGLCLMCIQWISLYVVATRFPFTLSPLIRRTTTRPASRSHRMRGRTCGCGWGRSWPWSSSWRWSELSPTSSSSPSTRGDWRGGNAHSFAFISYILPKYKSVS